MDAYTQLAFSMRPEEERAFAFSKMVDLADAVAAIDPQKAFTAVGNARVFGDEACQRSAADKLEQWDYELPIRPAAREVLGGLETLTAK